MVAWALFGFILASPLEARAEGMSAVDLESFVSRAESAFGAGDESTFGAACTAVADQVTLLNEPLSVAQAARVHAFMALCSYSSQVTRPDFTEEDVKNAVTPYVRAARTADPRAGLGEGAQQDSTSPLTKYFAATSRDPAPGPTVPDVGWGRVIVDGRDASSIPTDTPAVVQRACGVGPFGPSRYLQAGAAVPDWDRCPMKPGTTRHIALGAGAGLAALAAIGFEIGAAQTYVTIHDDQTPAGDLESIRNQNRAFNYALLGTGAAALGLGVTLVATW